tara:strand:+ start:176 stop:394 length:219 start_codon:yes stop_codon:yes gene_type:complete
MEDNSRDLIEEALSEINKAKERIKILRQKINVANQGLEVIISMGDSMIVSVAEQTLQEMQNCEDQDSSQSRE